MKISTKDNEAFDFRLLEDSDGEILGAFFEGLYKETRSKFGPHPLTREYAVEELCPRVGSDNVSRYVIGSKEKVVGYFIVDFKEYPDERSRYTSYDINLDFTKDPVFAPCIADHYQSRGVASQAMYLLIKRLSEIGVNSLVLMGGTQAPNHLARSFYKKFGFEEQGEFYTGHNGLNNIDMRLVL